MKVAIMCNDFSSKKSDRTELIKLLNSIGNEVYIGTVYDGYINSYYKENDAKVILIEASRNNINPFIEIKSLLNISTQIKKEKIDIVIIYGVKNHIAMTIGSKLGGVKKIMCIVNGRGNLFTLKGLKGIVVRFMAFPLLRVAYTIADNICFQNIDDKKEFLRRHLIGRESKCFLTGGSGVNLSIYNNRYLEKENIFLFLARITESKGIREYIEAARIVKRYYPDATFNIVGPIDCTVEKSEVEEILYNACKEGIVIYHGETSDVTLWMSKCRFFIYPSYYPEGVPRCAMQAIAIGRPIITCNTPGCKEIIKDGINGFLIPPKDIRTLAKKMIWMIEHPDDIERMAKESRKYAEEKFDVNKINKSILKRLL
jgi:glycosyltransferase